MPSSPVWPPKSAAAIQVTSKARRGWTLQTANAKSCRHLQRFVAGWAWWHLADVFIVLCYLQLYIHIWSLDLFCVLVFHQFLPHSFLPLCLVPVCLFPASNASFSSKPLVCSCVASEDYFASCKVFEVTWGQILSNFPVLIPKIPKGHALHPAKCVCVNHGGLVNVRNICSLTWGCMSAGKWSWIGLLIISELIRGNQGSGHISQILIGQNMCNRSL